METEKISHYNLSYFWLILHGSKSRKWKEREWDLGIVLQLSLECVYIIMICSGHNVAL